MDRSRFHPDQDGESILQRWKLLSGKYLCTLGRLEPVFELIQRLRLTDRVRILEDVDDDALPALIRHAKPMVYPSFAEGFGMPVLEALASGVPVVTTDVTSLPEVAGDAAWQTSPSDVEHLAAVIRLALNEKSEMRKHRIERGLHQAACFTWHDAARNLLAAVRAAIA